MSELQRFALIRSKRRDVDERCDLWVCAGFGDDGATVGMADQNDFPRSGRDRPFREGYVVGKRRCGILNDGHVVAVLLEERINPLPSGPIDESAMHEDDGAR